MWIELCLPTLVLVTHRQRSTCVGVDGSGGVGVEGERQLRVVEPVQHVDVVWVGNS